jgi:hypothetical protein
LSFPEAYRRPSPSTPSGGGDLSGRKQIFRTFRFEDINYAVASKGDKEAMFLSYSELLNSFDSGGRTKTTTFPPWCPTICNSNKGKRVKNFWTTWPRRCPTACAKFTPSGPRPPKARRCSSLSGHRKSPIAAAFYWQNVISKNMINVNERRCRADGEARPDHRLCG